MVGLVANNSVNEGNRMVTMEGEKEMDISTYHVPGTETRGQLRHRGEQAPAVPVGARYPM